MKFTSAALSAVLSASAMAYPGMGADMGAFHKRGALEKRVPGPLPDNIAGASSAVADDIRSCLSTATSCEDSNLPKVRHSSWD